MQPKAFMQGYRRAATILGFLAATLGNESCRDAAADPTAGSNAPSVQFEHDMMVRFHMHENFGLVRAIERLLLRGKLEEAQNFAHAIAIAPDEAGLSVWATHATRVRTQAAALANATSLDDAFHHEAQLASECASCHVDTGVIPEFASPPTAPPDRESIEARMARHLWAADRLWEGMVGMADDSWHAGLDVLAARPLSAAELGPDREVFAKKLQRLAAQARKTRATDRLADRSVAYGEMLATCAACHTARPKP